MPIDLEDFPPLIRDSLEIFNRLGDRYETLPTGLIYIGKDYSSIEVFFRLYNIDDKVEQLESLEIIQHLDYKAVKKSTDKAKKDARAHKNK